MVLSTGVTGLGTFFEEEWIVMGMTEKWLVRLHSFGD